MSKADKRAHRLYYMNPGHPAYTELMRFGLALGTYWPAPKPDHPHQVKIKPTRVGADNPCNLFRREVGNRALLLIAVCGGLTPMQVFREAGMFSTWDRADGSLRVLEKAGLLARDQLPHGKGAGRGQPRKYRLNHRFAVYAEFESLLCTLVATLHQDIYGIAKAIGQRDTDVGKHVRDFEALYEP